MKITGRGNYPVIDSELVNFKTTGQLQQHLTSSTELIPRGLGRSYGDSSLNRSRIVSTLDFNKILAFNPQTGLITCEAGVTLEDILRIFVPRGWFVPVTPGTQFVTVGGMVASDVHGKNHHIDGSFSSCVETITLMTADGEITECGGEKNRELFDATLGGMGLTGIIIHVSFYLKPIQTSYIREEVIKAKNLESIMALFEQSKSWTYSVAWIDCLAKGSALGRSILMLGEHANITELPEKIASEPLKIPAGKNLSVPFNFPNLALNSLSVKAFNFLYFHKEIQARKSVLTTYDQFFYPLDSILNWNRIYGRRGFTQYQFVIPKRNSEKGMRKILEVIAASGQASFLAVLKLFGKQEGLLSFPEEGYTLALDFPVTKQLFPLLNRLDDIVGEAEGRLYLTKDVRMDRAFFEKSYGSKVETFKKIKNSIDPNHKFQSEQSKRIGL